MAAEVEDRNPAVIFAEDVANIVERVALVRTSRWQRPFTSACSRARRKWRTTSGGLPQVVRTIILFVGKGQEGDGFSALLIHKTILNRADWLSTRV
jgi:hypothetical protein